ncbi:MAG: Gfo/Idh/MocA family oxidoreductase [Pirellulales bacterium]|nr:Gfo/Idh/MocA family oxidoreductase [Pirellulales bacterium]
MTRENQGQREAFKTCPSVAEAGKDGWTRRRMLQGTVAGLAAVSIVPRDVLGGPGQEPPSERPRLAGVGVGGVGFGHVQACERAGFDVAVLCDVDDLYAKRAYDKWPQARRYRDFREMLDAEGDKIDAVYCGTPDHTHTVITLAALRKKKHVCCVKPLTRTVAECRAVVRAAAEAGVATQVTASPNTSEAGCRTCELIWAGAIGDVREVHIWSNRPLWPQGMLRPPGEGQVPSTLDWGLWIGPAPMRPFVAQWPDGHLALAQVPSGRPPKAVYHPWNFRGWWDFGTGALGDMGCHHLNTPFRALKLEHATGIQATATRVLEETAPLASIVSYDFPAREEMPPVRVIWYDGGLKPPAPLGMEGKPLPAEGILYVGDQGKMLRSEIIPSSRAKQFENVPRTLPRRPGTWGEWMEACRGGEPAGCSFDWAGLLTEFVLLGNIAIRTGKQLQWDSENMRFTNDGDANGQLNPPYHNGWSFES